MTFEQWSKSIEQVIWGQKLDRCHKIQLVQRAWGSIRHDTCKEQLWYHCGWRRGEEKVVVRSPGETWGLEHRSGCRKHRKGTWKPPWGFKGRVTRSECTEITIMQGRRWYTGKRYGAPKKLEERGYYRLRRARKASGGCIDGQWERPTFQRTGNLQAWCSWNPLVDLFIICLSLSPLCAVPCPRSWGYNGD